MIWAVAIALSLGVVVLPALFALNPSLYSSSHLSRPYYDSWRTDRHRGAAPNCVTCHLEPGLLGVVIYPVTFYGGVLSGLFRGALDAPREVMPSDAACQRAGCHSLNRLQSLSGNILVNHRVHSEIGNAQCIKCHPGAGHAGQNGRSVLPPMSLCEECHADRMDDCGYCHIGQALPTSAP